MSKSALLAATVACWVLATTSAGMQGGVRSVPQKGYQEQTGHYDVDPNWPKPLPDNDGKWTWGAVQGIFAENPDRVFIVMRGELPKLERPRNTPIPAFGPSLSFPVNQTPFRNASQGPVASPPTYTSSQGLTKEGVDYRWRNILFIVDRNGNLVESWRQWDTLLKRPHAVYENPYDPEKHVWVVDDAGHTVHKFTNDGKKKVLTLGTQDTPGNDDKHFNRPTFLTWLPDSTMFVADGYANTRVVKFDKDGKYLTAWGQPGTNTIGPNAPAETRPGYFNTVHGIAVDTKRRVYVNDRSNRRVQVFDENGKYLHEWTIGDPPAHFYSIFMGADGYLWGIDAGTWRFVKYDLDGKFQYTWGFQGDAPGGLWGAHQISVDQEGNVYVSEVSNGRAQKFRPMKGADPTKLLGKPLGFPWAKGTGTR